jgi:hypothetical protein
MGTATGTDLNQCTITQQNVTKANNQELAAAVNGSGYQLIDVQQQGNVFYLVYGYSMYNPQVVYTIDTNYHSILNPVQTQNISGSSVSRTSISYLQTFGF